MNVLSTLYVDGEIGHGRSVGCLLACIYGDMYVCMYVCILHIFLCTESPDRHVVLGMANKREGSG